MHDFQVMEWKTPKQMPSRRCGICPPRPWTGRSPPRDPLVIQSRLEVQAQDFCDFAHGTPLGWHWLSRGKNRAA